MKKTASADAIFQAFDKRIEDFLAKNRKSIIQEYRTKMGRAVQDQEVDAFVSGLGDSLYELIQPDASHLDRFVNFYASDDKLQKAVSDAIESSSNTYSPGKAASDIKKIADALASAKSPSLAKTSRALASIISRLSTVRVVGSGMDELKVTYVNPLGKRKMTFEIESQATVGTITEISSAGEQKRDASREQIVDEIAGLESIGWKKI